MKNTKLTLSCNEKNIRFAKRYAKRKKLSISALVDQWFEILQQLEKNPVPEDEFVDEFSGIIESGIPDLKNRLFSKTTQK